MDIPTTVSQTVGQLLDELATRFGATAEHLWAILVRQSVVVGWLWAAATLVALAVACIASRQYFIAQARICHRDKDGHSLAESRDWYAVRDYAPFFGFLALIVAGICAFDAVPRLLNPEFHALQFLLTALGGGAG